MNAKEKSQALYVYGLTHADFALDLGAIGIAEGGSPAPVFPVRAGRVAALVSARKDRSRVLPLRRDLDAHQTVTSRVLESGTILPFAFGQVARNERAVVTLLRNNEAGISAELDRLEGKVQMGLKIQWDVANIYQYIVDADPELAELRSEVFTDPSPDVSAKLELGARFDETLQLKRAALVEAVVTSLPMSAAPPQELPVRGENMIADLMFLIRRNDRGRFEQRVQRLASSWPDEYTFRVSGPWAPFNFVELQLPGSPDGGATWAS